MEARGELFFFFPKTCSIFSALSIVKYKPGKTNNKFLNNFYLMTSHQRDQKESDELLYWSLVMVRNQLPAQRG